jgi:sortase A
MSRRSTTMIWIERALSGIASACFVCYGIVVSDARAEQAKQRQRLEATMAAARADTAAMSHFVAVPGTPIGRLEIPRLQLTATIIQGETDGALKAGVGHLADTPLPWQPGNSAFAAHRDTHFRPLKDVRRGDIVNLTTPLGSFTYRVRTTVVVDPEDLWVLKPADGHVLTLITCYPFSYVGTAPKRFVVQAERQGQDR